MTVYTKKEIEAQLAAARKIPQNFAYCMGSEPSETAFLSHKTKLPEVLARVARAEADTPKVAFGQLLNAGKVIEFRCENAPPAQLKRDIRDFFEEYGLKFKIKIIGPDGTVDADEIEEGDLQVDETDTLKEKWDILAPSLAPKVAKAFGRNGDLARKLWPEMEAKAAAGNHKNAFRVVPGLVKLLTRADRQKRVSEQDTRRRFTRLADVSKTAVARNSDARDQLIPALGHAKWQFDRKDWPATDDALDRLEQGLRQIAR